MEINYEEEMQNQNLISNGPIHFDSAREMYDYLRSAGDLYSPKEMLYVFGYNSAGAIAVYDISEEEAKELSHKMEKYEEDWSALLGPGGRIYDALDEYCEEDYAMEFCEDWYRLEWYDTIDYKELVLKGEA